MKLNEDEREIALQWANSKAISLNTEGAKLMRKLCMEALKERPTISAQAAKCPMCGEWNITINGDVMQNCVHLEKTEGGTMEFGHVERIEIEDYDLELIPC